MLVFEIGISKDCNYATQYHYAFIKIEQYAVLENSYDILKYLHLFGEILAYV